MGTSTASSATMNHASGRREAADARRQKLAPRRTTITLSPEAQEIIERFKSASGASTSAAIDQIIRRSDPKPSRLKESDLGLLVLDVPFRRVNVTLEDVKRAEDEMDREYVGRLLPSKKKSVSKASRTGIRK